MGKNANDSLSLLSKYKYLSAINKYTRMLPGFGSSCVDRIISLSRPRGTVPGPILFNIFMETFCLLLIIL